MIRIEPVHPVLIWQDSNSSPPLPSPSYFYRNKPQPPTPKCRPNAGMFTCRTLSDGLSLTELSEKALEKKRLLLCRTILSVSTVAEINTAGINSSDVNEKSIRKGIWRRVKKVFSQQPQKRLVFL